MPKKRTFKEFKQGIYKPINKDKCLNKSEIFYRSGLELSVMLALDKNPNVIEWNSEGHIIPYIKPTTGQPARYFVDFYMKVRMKDGKTEKFLVEVKPHKQTMLKEHGNAKPSTILYDQIQFAINTAKWDACRKWCALKGYTFLLMTEKDIDKLKSI